jgi:hypothetical protein
MRKSSTQSNTTPVTRVPMSTWSHLPQSPMGGVQHSVRAPRTRGSWAGEGWVYVCGRAASAHAQRKRGWGGLSGSGVAYAHAQSGGIPAHAQKERGRERKGGATPAHAQRRGVAG